MSIEKYLKRLKIRWRNIELYEEALTHSSYKNEHPDIAWEHNERLEFFGDAILEFVISEYLYEEMGENHREGELTKLRSRIVSEEGLQFLAAKLNIAQMLRLGKGEEKVGARERPSTLADAVEAFIAAVYIDRGMAFTKKFILRNFRTHLVGVLEGESLLDYKSILQEKLQRSGKRRLHYKVDSVTGPDHLRHFKVTLYIDNKPAAQGEGASRRSAEKDAARRALE
ncbi:MAG TPA: ribonuclease III [Tissierellia bacterium]|nr:ribonuclease III [Tissierellia bacterium]